MADDKPKRPAPSILTHPTYNPGKFSSTFWFGFEVSDVDAMSMNLVSEKNPRGTQFQEDLKAAVSEAIAGVIDTYTPKNEEVKS